MSFSDPKIKPVCKFAPHKGILERLGFWTPRLGFQIPCTGFQSFSVELGFWVRIDCGIPDLLRCIEDSKVQDSRFHKQDFPRDLFLGHLSLIKNKTETARPLVIFEYIV